MDKVFYAAWDAMHEYCTSDGDAEMILSQRDAYAKECCDLYERFAKKMMKEGSDSLDSHKTGAVIAVVASAEADKYIRCTKTLDETKIFWGRYTIPLLIALSYTEQELNRELKEFKLIGRKESIKLYIPKPWACLTEYIDALGRILYYEVSEEMPDTIRVLELANTFFLLEVPTLLANRVNINKWVTMKRACINE